MSVREQVEEYVEERPYVQEALAEQIVNYSALARKAQEEIDGSFEAVKMALRRVSEDLQNRRKTRKTNVGEVLEGTSIELQSNVEVLKTDELEEETEVFSRTEHGYTLIQENGSEASGDVIDNQVMISLKSPQDLEDTPGVLAYVLQVLAGREINVTELMSCREDTHIVIDEEDATKTFELLNSRLR
ncbi:MAG: ACT domain-containing protein [Candidatus Nanohaloarchaea archaeon]